MDLKMLHSMSKKDQFCPRHELNEKMLHNALERSMITLPSPSGAFSTPVFTPLNTTLEFIFPPARGAEENKLRAASK